MILTCDNCHTRYDVAPGEIRQAGRRVRCSKCGHEWEQYPEDAISDDDDFEIGFDGDDERVAVVSPPEGDIDLEPIPESVKPQHGDFTSLMPPVKTGGMPDRLLGYAAALVVFMLTCMTLCLMRNSITVAWPPAAAFYNMMNMPAHGRGDGLVFEEVKAVSAPNEQGVAMLKITGKIGNVRNYTVQVPAIRAELRLGDGKVADSWQVAPPETVIKGNAELAFTTTYPEAPDAVKDVKLSFALDGKKTAKTAARTE